MKINFNFGYCVAILCFLSATPAIAETVSMPPPECLVLDKQIYDATYPWLTNKRPNTVPQPSLFDVAALKQLSDLLEMQGKKLVVIPMLSPSASTPPSIARDNDVDVSGLLREHTVAIDKILDGGVEAFDVAKAVQSLPNDFRFQRTTDHHWTAEGAVYTAYKLSQFLFSEIEQDEQGVLASLETLPFSTFKSTTPTFRKLVSESCNLNDFFIEDKRFTFPTTPMKKANVADALFSDDTSDTIALLGTSFSAKDAGQNFPRALEYYSQKPLLDFSTSGGGGTTSWLNFINDGALENSTVKHVIWEPSYLTQFDTISGAANFASGMISGACANDDLFFSSQNISTEYGVWNEVSEFVGLISKASVYAEHKENLQFKVIFLDKSESTFSSFLNGGNIDDPEMPWTFLIPQVVDSNGQTKIVESLHIMVSGYRNYAPKGPLSFDVSICAAL